MMACLLGIFPAGVRSDPAALRDPSFDPRAGAGFQFVPPLDKAHRIDFTSDLLDWYPLEVLPSATPARTILDADATNRVQRFYRSVEIDPVPGIYGFDPDPVSAGAVLTIDGQFFSAAPGQNRVTISGVDARVIEAGLTRLKVEVPASAKSGVLRVTTPAGEAVSATDLTVEDWVTVRLVPPAGYDASDFLAGSPGDGRKFTNGLTRLRVAAGPPAVVYAVSQNTNRLGFLAGVLTNGSNEATLDAQSTARAILFLNPLLAHQDSEVAAQLYRELSASAAVRQLGEAWARALLKPGDPIDDPEVMAAHTNALDAVFANPNLARTALERQSRRALLPQSARVTTAPFYHEPPAKRWLEVDSKPGRLKPAGFPFNPVDWVVRFQEIDVDKAFPEGRFDLQAILRQANPPPTPHPLRAGFDETRTISADLAASRINFVSYLSKEFFKLIAGKALEDPVLLPRENTIYVMRGVGPAIQDSADYDFNTSYLLPEYHRAIAMNIVAAVIDSVSAVLDFKKLDKYAKDSKDTQKFYAKLINEAAKLAPNIRDEKDFLKAAAKIFQFFFKEVLTQYLKSYIPDPRADPEVYVDAAGAFSLRIGKLGEAFGNLIDNKYLKAGASVGQVVERASGMVRTTPLETAFIVVGEPFKLDVSVNPAVAGLGEEVTVTIRGSSALRAFATNSTRDQVNFEGPVFFDGQVLAVTGPENGEQRLRVRIPADLANSADGAYTMFVNTQGRKGSASFRVALRTTITGLAPAFGFAAVSDFGGSPFSGSSIAILGANMSAQDAVLFTGTGGPAPATSKFAATGGLRVNVPAGAVTGPIRVDHRNVNGQMTSATSAVFTVLGPPVIESMTPQSGPPGTLVLLQVSNAGDNSTARIEFPLGFSSGVTFVGTNLIVAPVPAKSTSGPVRIVTPAGFAEREFTVTAAPAFTNLQLGSTIPVGGSSVVTLERGFAMANGDTFPEDDTDYVIIENRRTELDPPREEGDYVQPDNIGVKDVPRFVMGLAYSDTVILQSPQSGTVAMRAPNDRLSADSPLGGELTMASVNCFASGTFQGTVRITGHFNSLSGTSHGTVIVTGNSNRLSGRYAGPVIVEGDYNTLSGEFNDTVTLAGRFNKFGLQTSNVRSNRSTAVIVRGDNNTVAANFRNNATNAVVVDGAKFTTIDFNSCTDNGGHGLVLQGGASYNTVVMRSGVQTGSPRQVVRGSGNGGHAVLLTEGASFNTLSGEFSGNGLDGVLMDGPEVHDNKLNGQFLLNGRNGVTVANGAHGNSLGVFGPNASSFSAIECNGNGQNGVAILGGLQTTGGVYASTNGASGLLFSGVNETVPQGTYFILLTAPFTGNAGNLRAGLRMEGKVSGVTVMNTGYRLKQDGVGVELEGEEVTGNTLNLRVTESIGNGVAIRKARKNNLRFEISLAGGTGLLLDGAEENDIRITSIEDNKGPGVLLTGGAAGNKVRAAVFSGAIRRNQNGVRIEGGSHDNMLDTLDVAANGDYGLVITGGGARNNLVARCTFVGALKDGVLIENGASDNTIGVESDNPFVQRVMNLRDNALSGIRVTGAGTRGNNIVRCLFLPTSNALQPAGLLVEKGAADTAVVGGTFFRNVQGILVADGAQRVSVTGARFQSNTFSAITISNASSVVVGGPLQNDQNQIFNNPTGVLIAGSEARDNRISNNLIHDNVDGVALAEKASRNLVGADNRIDLNVTGIRIENAASNTVANNIIVNNQTSGVILHAGAAGNRIDDNQISGNSTGVLVTGAGSVRNTITRNRIFGHPLPRAGISLAGGGNTMLEAPKLIEVQANAVVGTAEAPDGSRIELFQDADDEGEILVASGTVVEGRFRVPAEIDMRTAGFLFNVTGTVTDPDGNTSEFGVLEREEFPESRLVFSSTRTGNSEIFSRGGSSPGGGGNAAEENLTRHASRDESPSVAEGCEEALFVSDRDQNREIYKVAIKPNSTAVRLTSNAAADYDPSWLEPCQKVVFVSERDGNAEIYSMNADGSLPTRLTSNPASDRWPRVSPDGGRILYVSDRSGSASLWTMNVDGSDQRPLVPAGIAGSEPAWSPAGTHIAFVSSRDGNPEIYVVATDGSGLVRLTNDSGTDLQPAWAPGGRQVLFSSNRTGNYEIYSVSRNGGAPSRLTVTTGDNFSPNAQPR